MHTDSVPIPRYARPRSRKGCTIDQSLPRIFLQGPCSRTPWFLAPDILALPSGVRYAYTPVTNLFLSPLCLTLTLFPFLSRRECVFSSLLSLPDSLLSLPPSPPRHSLYILYLWKERGKPRESLIGKLESRGVPATDVPRWTIRGKGKRKGLSKGAPIN